jgi:hypothetical protein
MIVRMGSLFRTDLNQVSEKYAFPQEMHQPDVPVYLDRQFSPSRVFTSSGGLLIQMQNLQNFVIRPEASTSPLEGLIHSRHSQIEREPIPSRRSRSSRDQKGQILAALMHVTVE